MSGRGVLMAWAMVLGLVLLGPGVAEADRGITQYTGVVNLNEASAEELDRLPGVGRKAAERILTHRQKKPFQRIECLTTYDCCIARNSSTPEVCGAPPGTRPLGPTVALVPKPDTATLADTTTAPDAETRELCDSYLKKCNKSWISRVPGSTEGESQCASCYWKCRGLGYWPVRTDDGKACLPF